MASSPAILNPRRAASGHELTREQMVIMTHSPTKTTKWSAFAGAGKTSTAVEYTLRWTDPALYLAYNAAIAGDANGRFPSHVQVETAHAHARRALQVDLKRVTGRMWPEHLDHCASLIRPMSRMTEVAIRRAILATLGKFLISGSEEVQIDHMTSFPAALRQSAIEMVRAVVKRVLDFESHDGKITHDVYLKAFALHHRISDRFKYIIVDEAQDLNPVLLQIVGKSGRPLIIIGDPYQQIYAWRGANNAMAEFNCETLPLSQSFRFGPNVAAVANFILKQHSDPPELPLRGNPGRDTKVGVYGGTLSGRATIIARTNFRLFEGAVGLMAPGKKDMTRDELMAMRAFHVVGGIDELVSQVESGYRLSKGFTTDITDPLIKRYKTWADLVEESEMKEEPELLRLIKIIDAYGDAIPQILSDMREFHVSHSGDARFILTTAHRAKGREWSHVVIVEDFLTFAQLRAMIAKKRITRAEFDAEVNLAYVAYTRGMDRLSVAPELWGEIAVGTGLPTY